MSRATRPSWAARAPRLEALVEKLTATPAIPVLIAIVLGLHRIGEKSVWLDEGVSVAIARASTSDMLHYLRHTELHASPFYLTLHPWTFLGTSETAVRSLAIVFGVVAVLATWSVGKRYGVAFGAALILSVTPVFIEYEQEARTYTLLMATSAIATLLYLRMTERWTVWRGVLYVLAGGLLIYVQPIGAFVVVAHGLAVLLFRPRAEWRRLLQLFAPIFVLWLPMIVFAWRNSDRIAWIEPITIDLAFNHLVALGGGLVAGAVLVILLVLGARRDVVTLWLVVPIVGIIALSIFVQPTLQKHYLLGVIPAAAIIAARNRPALIAVLLAVSLVGVWNWYDRGIKDDWRGAAAWVTAEMEPGDGIVFDPGFLRHGYSFYASAPEPVWPAFSWSSSLRPGPTDLTRFDGVPRIWLVQGHESYRTNDVAESLAPFRALETRQFAGGQQVRVTLLARDPSGTE